MKYTKQLIAFALIICSLTACESPYKISIATKKKTVLTDAFQISVADKNGQALTKALFYVNGKEIKSEGLSATVKASDYGVGKHLLSAMVYFGDGKSKKVNNSFEVLADKGPSVCTYKVVNRYPHDPKAYTQGLEFHKGFLYETTGRNGQSSLRKVDLKTGKVLQQINLDKRYFGEGMTIVGEQIFFLTWKASKGFVYDLKTFELQKEFKYNRSKEGWGLTHNETELIKSDGTNRIWFLDLTTQKEKRNIQAYTNTRPVGDLNELELVNGKIYANKWQQNVIVIIDPNTGIVEGIADLDGLRQEVAKTQKLDPSDDVLNGIAYDAEKNRLFVTGKNWNTLFEIELREK